MPSIVAAFVFPSKGDDRMERNGSTAAGTVFPRNPLPAHAQTSETCDLPQIGLQTWPQRPRTRFQIENPPACSLHPSLRNTSALHRTPMLRQVENPVVDLYAR